MATYIFLNLSGIVESLSLHQKHGNLLLDVHAQVFVEFQNFLEEGLAILGIHYSGFIAFWTQPPSIFQGYVLWMRRLQYERFNSIQFNT